MTYVFERVPTLKEARAMCAELERNHPEKFCGIYRGHRTYVVRVTDVLHDLSSQTKN